MLLVFTPDRARPGDARGAPRQPADRLGLSRLRPVAGRGLRLVDRRGRSAAARRPTRWSMPGSAIRSIGRTTSPASSSPPPMPTTFWPRIDAGLDEARNPRRCAHVRLGRPADRPRRVRAARRPLRRLTCNRSTTCSTPSRLGATPGSAPNSRPAWRSPPRVTSARNSLWSDARLRFDVGPGIRSEAELGVLIAFFRARRGAARGFRLSRSVRFQLERDDRRARPARSAYRRGRRPRLDASSLPSPMARGPNRRCARSPAPVPRPCGSASPGVETSDFALDPGGRLVLATAPAAGRRSARRVPVRRAGALCRGPPRRDRRGLRRGRSARRFR